MSPTNVGRVIIDTSGLDRMLANAEPEAHKIIGEYGELVVGDAMKNAPYKTGALRASIGAESDFVSRLVFRITDGVGYGIFQELGFIHWITGQFIQHPFMVPALEKWTEPFKAAFSRIVPK